MTDTAKLLPILRAAAGLSEPQTSQFEDIRLHDTVSAPDGTLAARFSYSFNQDGHSQYDETLDFEGQASFHPDTGWTVDSMRVSHIGDAANYDPPPALRRRPGEAGK